MQYARWMRYAGIFLALKASVHLIVTLFGTPPLPAPIFAGLAVLWLLGAIALLWMAQTMQRELRGVTAPSPHRTSVESASAQSTPATRTRPTQADSGTRIDTALPLPDGAAGAPAGD